jgi:hypothetical protein
MVDTEVEYAGAEQMVIRYYVGGDLMDANAYLVYTCGQLTHVMTGTGMNTCTSHRDLGRLPMGRLTCLCSGERRLTVPRMTSRKWVIFRYVPS